MLVRLILAIALGALAFAGFKLVLYNDQLSAPYDMLVWFLGSILLFIGTFGALGVAYDIIHRSSHD